MKSNKQNTVKAMGLGIALMLGLMAATNVSASAETAQPTQPAIKAECDANTISEIENGYTYTAEDGSRVIINNTTVETDSESNVVGMASSALRVAP